MQDPRQSGAGGARAASSPSPQAFDEVLHALTSSHSVSSTLEDVRKKRRPAAKGPDRRSAACEAIRQKLRLAVMYDEAKIDRLIAAERERQPGATDEQLHAAAYERWCRDNRS